MKHVSLRQIQLKALGEGNGTPLQYSCLENPMEGGAWWAAVHGITRSWTQLSDFTFTFHFHALEKEMASYSSVLAWRIPGMEEPRGLPSMGLHRVGHDWSDLAAAAACDVTGRRGKYESQLGSIFHFMEEENMYSNITQVRRGAGELCAEDEPGMERLCFWLRTFHQTVISVSSEKINEPPQAWHTCVL